MEEIVKYIMREYEPLSVIVYGSYANDTANQNSDFDALVISQHPDRMHDTTIINGIPLDVFVYPASFFEGAYDCADFLQLVDSKIILDTDERGRSLQAQVISYLKNRPQKTGREIQADVAWCEKMLERTKRHDAEGMFRWHWLLVDSLEIFCDMTYHPYLGPKKTLKWMEEQYPDSYTCYENALKEFSHDSLANWISHIKATLAESYCTHSQ